MFKFWVTEDASAGTKTANYSGAFSADLDTHLVKGLRTEIITKLTKAWIDKFGAELIDSLSPKDVEKAIKTALARKILD